MDITTAHPERGTGFLKTSFNGINALSGIGILSIPYALSQGGWLSLIVFAAIAIICYYTGILLQRCVDSSSRIKNYTDVGEVAFGRKGRILAATVMYLELYLAAIDFLIMEGDNLDKLFPAVSFRVTGRLTLTGKQAFVLIASLVVLPTTWLRSLGKLAYVSLGGVLASAVLVAAILWIGAFDGVGFHERGVPVHWAGLPTAMSLFAFCFSSHPVIPKLYLGMRDRKMFPKVLVVCFAVSAFGYGLTGVAGYLMYGASTQSQVTLNLPPGNLRSKIAIYTTLVNPLTKYALFVIPIADAVEDSLRVADSRPVSIAIRTALVVGTTVAALAVPLFGYVTMLTGALMCSSVIMLMPCACYLKISSMTSRKLAGFERVACVGIMVLAVGIAVVGTYIALKQTYLFGCL
ncbi:amino acid transporter AVT1I-like [Panicum hallii]|uniref:amino acid transporter AVT1I-like n=1 Tax=Panicum hallii TaxID=206008 RepID=UPI000DF4D1FD|nr:amino acid transporter AVT1I-like [Panicum hallii]